MEIKIIGYCLSLRDIYLLKCVWLYLKYIMILIFYDKFVYNFILGYVIFVMKKINGIWVELNIFKDKCWW